MKQTAIEWLHDTWGNYPDLWSWEKIQEWFAQAKEIEKEQILDAYRHGRTDEKSGIEKWHNRTALKYFNDTYTETL
jgi:hypothetical protein